MTDRVSKAVRSRSMAGVRTANTKPELIVRRYLRRAGVHFRGNVRGLPGRPDLVLPRHKIAVFVHGCFWHQHPGCPRSNRPTSNETFWNDKLSANVTRDARVASRLRRDGWHVFKVWSCAIDERKLESLVRRIRSVQLRALRSTPRR